VWTAETVLVCALSLLARAADSLPPIVLLASRPPDVSRQAEGFVRLGDPRIYILTDTVSFERARRAPGRCGDVQSLRKIASVVAHEAWHVQHPGDEPGAYIAQLSALIQMGAGPGSPLYLEVWRSRRAALQSSGSDARPAEGRKQLEKVTPIDSWRAAY
jgi:hypothetical protein